MMIRNRQYRQLRRLRRERLTHSALPQPLLSASYCMIYCRSAAAKFFDRDSEGPKR